MAAQGFRVLNSRCYPNPSITLQVAHDTAAGLAYLHPSVVHRDLKPQNVLMDLDGRAKIADFGAQGLGLEAFPVPRVIRMVLNCAWVAGF